MDTSIEEIKSKTDIVEFIGSYIPLKKAGRNFKGNCPFHQEKTPSFVISPERQIWHCFGACGEGGDAIKFLMKWENVTFFEALKELALRAGVKLARVDFEDKEWIKKEQILKMNYLASEFYQYLLLQTSFGKKALAYLTNRKLSEKVIKSFGLGYAPASWDSLLQFLKKKGFPLPEIYEAGLVVKSEGGHYYDRFRGRIIFPIMDVKGNVIGFSGRALDQTEKMAKYVNTPETAVYHKRESLYGIHKTKDAIRKSKSVVIVEGEFDLISPFQQGIENIVAIKGTALTQEQVKILKRYASKFIFALDMDTAGEEAIRRGMNQADYLDVEMYVVRFKKGKDPDEAIQLDAHSFIKAVQSPVPIYDFMIDFIKKKYPEENPFHKKKIGEELAPMIAHIQNPIIASHYQKKLAHILEVDEDSVGKLVFRAKRAAIVPRWPIKTMATVTKTTREELVPKYLLSLLLQNESAYEMAKRIFSHLQPHDFSIPSLQKIAEHFLIFERQNPGGFSIKLFFHTLPKELLSLADELYLFASSETALKNEKIEKLVYQVRRISLKNQIALLTKGETLENKGGDQEISLLQESLKSVENSLMSM